MNTQRVHVGDERVPTSEWEVIEFEGREVAFAEGVRDSIDPNDPDFQFGYTFRLYESPEGYRVHEILWRVSPDQVTDSSLYPVVGDLGYGTYTEQDVKEKWGQYFEDYFRSPE